MAFPDFKLAVRLFALACLVSPRMRPTLWKAAYSVEGLEFSSSAFLAVFFSFF